MDNNQLIEIQNLARRFNDELYHDFGDDRVNELTSGGNLFLGTHYAESDIILMTYNPGKANESNLKFETSFARNNRYWDKYEDKEYQFWKNSKFFFNSQPDLINWLNMNHVTSAFLIPWRTRNITAFESDKELKQRIYEYSGNIVRRILEHHQSKILIISGIATLRCLASEQFLDFDLNQSIDHSKNLNLGPNYQCRKVTPNRNYETLNLFQIPHFSRANKKSYLEKCSAWLWNEIFQIKL